MKVKTEQDVDLSRIRVVLVNTGHPGNIGAVARAMKNMGISKLYLVDPSHPPLHPYAVSRAAGADNILDDAVTVDKLVDAVADCSWVVGASARLRSIPVPVYEPRECAEKAIDMDNTNEVALVLGRERTGLTNEELECCNYLVHIPADPDYSSLNIAAAAQVLLYEFRMAARQQVGVKMAENEPQYRLANNTEMEGMYGHFEQALTELGFLKTKEPGLLMRRLRRLFNRAKLDTKEMSILRGILSASQGSKYKHQSNDKSDSE